MTDKPAAPATPWVEQFWTHDTSENGRKDFARRLETLCRQQHEALERIEKWEFDWRGDCVAEAKAMARTTLAAYAALEK